MVSCLWGACSIQGVFLKQNLPLSTAVSAVCLTRWSSAQLHHSGLYSHYFSSLVPHQTSSPIQSPVIYRNTLMTLQSSDVSETDKKLRTKINWMLFVAWCGTSHVDLKGNRSEWALFHLGKWKCLRNINTCVVPGWLCPLPTVLPGKQIAGDSARGLWFFLEASTSVPEMSLWSADGRENLKHHVKY